MKKNCKPVSFSAIVGGIFLVVATILTILTYSGVGVLGMFLVGFGFCACKHMGCKSCCSNCCKCDCCSTDMTECDVPKAPTPRKKAKKAV